MLLLAVLGFQGPKTLKMLKGPQPVAAPASTSTAPRRRRPLPVRPLRPAPARPRQLRRRPLRLSAVADSDLSPEAEQGQLATFERFASKDPFAQQAAPVQARPPRVSEPRTAPSRSRSTRRTTPVRRRRRCRGETARPTAASRPEARRRTPGDRERHVDLRERVAEDVAVEGSFPKDEPTFVLVKVAKNGKSVEIGIAGGEYASGGETITLGLGKKITLQNTADEAATSSSC